MQGLVGGEQHESSMVVLEWASGHGYQHQRRQARSLSKSPSVLCVQQCLSQYFCVLSSRNRRES